MSEPKPASKPSSSGARGAVEVAARTVDEAIARGLVRLGGLSRAEVQIDVLREGRAGLLGFGAEDALVRLTPVAPGTGAAGQEAVPPRKGRRSANRRRCGRRRRSGGRTARTTAATRPGRSGSALGCPHERCQGGPGGARRCPARARCAARETARAGAPTGFHVCQPSPCGRRRFDRGGCGGGARSGAVARLRRGHRRDPGLVAARWRGR
ncbi:MAG: Jag N-terminal domain-containing protein [Ardenticatenales bacterium]|nr:Jag N-terminal domain-containing protein [Ardenticatenales bacterium]